MWEPASRLAEQYLLLKQAVYSSELLDKFNYSFYFFLYFFNDLFSI